MRVEEVYAKRVLSRHRRDPWFLDEYALNPYVSCEFSCVYCYAHGRQRPGYLGVKVNAPLLLSRELRGLAERGEYGFIALSSATEPWTWAEERLWLTRRCLEVIARHRFPVHCLTKSPLVLRDLDLLAEVDSSATLPPDLREEVGRGVLITFSMSALDEEVARVFEPNAPSPRERLEALSRVREEGFCAGVALVPTLPLISDSQEALDEVAKAAKEHGACYVFFSPLTLPGPCWEEYMRVLERRFPELAERCRRVFGRGGHPTKRYVNAFYRRALAACHRHGIRFGVVEGCLRLRGPSTLAGGATPRRSVRGED